MNGVQAPDLAGNKFGDTAIFMCKLFHSNEKYRLNAFRNL